MSLKGKIEERSVSILNSIIAEDNQLEGHIETCDKNISYDGHILVFRDDNTKSDKANYEAKVPVQVKGHEDYSHKYIGNDHISFPVNVQDLKIYYRENGCLYFEIFMTSDIKDHTVFYSCLYPSRIKSYFDHDLKGINQKSISIPFIALTEEGNNLWKICDQFILESRKQGSGMGQIVPHMISITEKSSIRNITATTTVTNTESPYLQLLNRINKGEVNLYAKIDSSGVEYPIDMNDLTASFGRVCQEDITINGKVYYHSFEEERIVNTPESKSYKKGETIRIKPGNNIIITIHDTSFHFGFCLNSDIFQMEDDARFTLEVIKKRKIKVGRCEFRLGDGTVPESFTYMMEVLILAADTLKDAGADIQIPFKELTDQDKSDIDILIGIKTGVRKVESEYDIALYQWKFRDKYWPVIVDKSKENIEIQNYLYNPTYGFCVEEQSNKIPQFSQFGSDILANLLYYDFASIDEQIESAVINDITYDNLVILIKNLMEAYEVNRIDGLYDAASRLLQRMIEVYPGDNRLTAISFDKGKNKDEST